MKAVIFKPFFLLIVLGLGPGIASKTFAQASADKAEKLIDVKEPSIQIQQTPDFTVKGVTNKRWKPKEWLEIEVPFEAKAPATKRDVKVYDALTFKYYLYVNTPDAKARKILTAELAHINIPVGEPMASVVYLPPAAITGLTGGGRAAPNLISMWGVEVFNGTQLVGFLTSTGKEWWKVNNAPPQTPGMLLNKSETPFAPLWFDYHATLQGGK
ncbi:MAG: Amuc_1102 family pilus-like protein [Verrucomicrobiales bacterium]